MNKDHTTIILHTPAEHGWGWMDKDIFQPACSCGVIPGTCYNTEREARLMAKRDLPARCR